MPVRIPAVLRLHARPSTFRRAVPYSTESTSTNTPAPPILLKFKSDLKNAMKAKDTNRLNVLRGLLADIGNASKTSSPVKTEMQVLALLRKRATAAKEAAQGFQEAQRADLVEKEEAQRKVLEEYAGGVETVGEEEVRDIVERAVEEMRADAGKLDKGQLLRRLIGPGGAFEGKNVEKALVVRITQEVAGK